jgi:hypothetical protein
MAAYGLLTARRTRGEYQPMLPRPNSMADDQEAYRYSVWRNPAVFGPNANGPPAQGRSNTPGYAALPDNIMAAQRRGIDLQVALNPSVYGPGANGPPQAGGVALEAGYNQTVAPNGLLREPITARGQYNNAMVANGGLLNNAQAAGLHTNTGYMTSKTVGGKWGVRGSGVPLRPGEPGYSSTAVGGITNLMGATQSQEPPADYRSPAAGLLGPGGKVTQEYLAAKFPGRYQLGDRGQMMPTESELSQRRAYAASPEGMANTARLAANREAYQERWQGLLADRRANVTQNAMARGAARRGRLEARNAPQQGMGLLEQMAMRDPRNAAQLLAMRQQGLLGQMQLQGQMQMQGNRIGLDRELGLLNAQNQRESNQATLARFGRQDSQAQMENFSNLVGALPALKQTNPALARQIEAQLPAMAGGLLGGGGQTAQPRNVARPKPPGAVGGILSQDEWESMNNMTPEQQQSFLRGTVTDPVQRRTVEKQLAGPGLFDYLSAGVGAIGGAAGDAISPTINGLFDDPAMPRQPLPSELDDQPDDSPQLRALKARLRQKYSVGRSSRARPVSF